MPQEPVSPARVPAGASTKPMSGPAGGAPGAGSDGQHLVDMLRYYRSVESRLLYWVLGGTKHYGYFRSGDPAWNVRHVYAGMRRMEDLLGQKLNLPTGAAVLDAGCGVGDVAARLAEVRGLRVTGIDVQAADVAEAGRRARRKKLAGLLQFQEMDYAALTFPDASYDGAYTVETLVHSDRVEDVLAGLYRVLRPGGTLVHFEYARSRAEDTPARDEQFMTEVNQVAAMPAFQRMEYGTLERLLGEAGFVDVQTEDITSNMLPMLRLFAAAGWLPYLVASGLGQTASVVNSKAGVEFYLHRQSWRYNIYTCRKPS